MGLSTYMTATTHLYQMLDREEYSRVHEALEDILPMGLGLAHNATSNVGIELPIASWHKCYSVDSFLAEYAGAEEKDEYTLDLDREEIVELMMKAREVATNPETAQRFNEEHAWIEMGFIRLERALTDFLLSDKLKGWTLKLWRSY